MVEQFPSPHSIRLMVWQQQHYNLAQPKRALVKKSPRQIREIRNTNKARKLLASQISKHNKLKTDKKKKKFAGSASLQNNLNLLRCSTRLIVTRWSTTLPFRRYRYIYIRPYLYICIYSYIAGPRGRRLRTEDWRQLWLTQKFHFLRNKFNACGSWVGVCVCECA